MAGFQVSMYGRFWVSTEAISRAQEGLSPQETVRAYRAIYFPAQEVHFERDNPKDAAAAIISNDARLGINSGLANNR